MEGKICQKSSRFRGIFRENQIPRGTIGILPWSVWSATTRCKTIHLILLGETLILADQGRAGHAMSSQNRPRKSKMQVMASYQQAENAPFSPRPSPSGRGTKPHPPRRTSLPANSPAAQVKSSSGRPPKMNLDARLEKCREAIAYAKNARSLAERLNLGTTAIEGV